MNEDHVEKSDGADDDGRSVTECADKADPFVKADEVKVKEEYSMPVGIGCNSESNITKHCYPSSDDEDTSESEESMKGEHMDMDAETAYQYMLEQQHNMHEQRVTLNKQEESRMEMGEEKVANNHENSSGVHNNLIEDVKKHGVEEEEDESEANCESTNDDSNSVSNVEGMETCRTFKIFVSNLPPGMLNSELAELFLKFGEVVECEIFAKNYAFVHMNSEDSGFKAMEELNGLDIRGCKINVKKSNQASGPKHVIKKSDEIEIGTYKLYIGNLIDDVTKEYVTKLLEPFGRIVEVEIFRHNAAFVHMETEAGAKNAMKELNGTLIPESEKSLLVTESKNNEGPSVAVMKLKVKNVATTVSAETLRNLFIPYGLVLKVKIFLIGDASRSAIVHLEQFGNIRSAIKELSGTEVEGSVIQVEPFFEPVKSAPSPMKPVKQSFPPIRPPSRSQFGQTYARIPRNLPRQDYNYQQFQPQPRMLHPGPRPPPMRMKRLIPMPSQAELGRYPVSGRGRVLVRPPPLMNQYHFRPPFQHEEYNDYNDYNSFEQGYYDETQNADYNEYNDKSYFNNDSSYGNMSYDAPPAKIPRNKRGKRPGYSGSFNQQRSFDSDGSQQGSSNQREIFPDFPSPDNFPKGPPPAPPSLMSVQVPTTAECDWSADLPLSNFDQFSNNQDFTADEQLATSSSTLNAVPFDYSQIGKKFVNNVPTAMAERLRNPNAQLYYNQEGKLKVRGNRGGRNAKAKGKSRRPGLGSTQQVKKATAWEGNSQSGNLEPLGIPPTETVFAAAAVQPEQASSLTTSSAAPSYFKQSWPKANPKKYGRKPATWKEKKEADEDQKRQYTDYLKQKPWLYQAIPGTVKRVDK
ncbi:RNA-binding protein lark [Orchesella cincta]|uniref:RNA-binding protein lark n=1 Tax=Orchesella cincta TaxID=48709 RepID=A0A1D2MTK9_ORCCI|nr:RNA-binding protein lark [Orchesella cincta]